MSYMSSLRERSLFTGGAGVGANPKIAHTQKALPPLNLRALKFIPPLICTGPPPINNDHSLTRHSRNENYYTRLYTFSSRKKAAPTKDLSELSMK